MTIEIVKYMNLKENADFLDIMNRTKSEKKEPFELADRPMHKKEEAGIAKTLEEQRHIVHIAVNDVPAF